MKSGVRATLVKKILPRPSPKSPKIPNKEKPKASKRLPSSQKLSRRFPRACGRAFPKKSRDPPRDSWTRNIARPTAREKSTRESRSTVHLGTCTRTFLYERSENSNFAESPRVGAFRPETDEDAHRRTADSTRATVATGARRKRKRSPREELDRSCVR